MERLKASFLLPVVLAGSLGLVFASVRRPVERGGGAVEKFGGRAAVKGEVALGDEARDMGDGVASTGKDGGALTGKDGIEWMTIEEAAGKLKQEKKPVLIDLYTTWCGWCKQMDRRTYSNKQVAQYLQEKFYTVRIDAETRSTIDWAGKTYRFNPQYRSNEFALYLTHGRLEFPTTIILLPGEEPQAIPGFLEPKEMELLVKYFGEGAYRAQSFDQFQKSFHPSWR